MNWYKQAFPSKYYNISEQEMDDFMSQNGFQRISVPGTYELVYAKRVDQGDLALSLRVYSGISQSGKSRAVGKDAMRVALFWRRPDGEVVQVGSGPHMKRIQTWAKNLQKRLDNWLDLLPKDNCPKCGSPLTIRKNRNQGTQFLGCANYPNCDYTRGI
tara:strand:- start:2529 stop:3002 length:474 start_codon:yes stop_codon:yes gene_type:complete